MDKNRHFLAMVVSGCIGTKESFLSSVCSWMVFWKVVHWEKFHPLWPILEKRMNLNIYPFSHESSVSDQFRWFLGKRMKHNFSHRNKTASYAWLGNSGGMGNALKLSIPQRFVKFGLNRLNLEKMDLFTRIVFSQKKNICLALLIAAMKISNIKQLTWTDCAIDHHP